MEAKDYQDLLPLYIEQERPQDTPIDLRLISLFEMAGENLEYKFRPESTFTNLIEMRLMINSRSNRV